MDNSQFLETLKQRDLRVTSARKAIFQVLSGSQKSMSVQDVFSDIQKTSEINTDRASVYRNLSLFYDMGLVHRFPGGKYSICTHRHDDHHQHMHIVASCSDCGNIIELNSHDEDICKAMKRITSTINTFSNFSGLTLQGLCKDCQ